MPSEEQNKTKQNRIFMSYNFINACDGKIYIFSRKQKQLKIKFRINSNEQGEKFYQGSFIDVTKSKSQFHLALETSTVKRITNCLLRPVSVGGTPIL